MGQDTRRIEGLYDRVAAEYAEVFSGELENKPMDREMLGRFSGLIGGRGPVWDLGCGPGQTTGYLRDLGVDISGLDISDKMLEQARSLNPAIGFRKGDMLDLELESGSIAGVVAFYAIVHFTLEQAGTAMREVSRILRPGGLLLLTYHIGKESIHLNEFLGKDVDIDFMFFSNDDILGCLKESGFGKIEIIEREPYPDVEFESRRAYVFAVKP